MPSPAAMSVATVAVVMVSTIEARSSGSATASPRLWGDTARSSRKSGPTTKSTRHAPRAARTRRDHGSRSGIIFDPSSLDPMTGDRADDQPDDAGRLQRADEARILLLVPVPLNVSLLRGGEPPRLGQVDARAGHRGGEARDE